MDPIIVAYPGEIFTLDLIDTVHGGWGSIAMDTATVPVETSASILSTGGTWSVQERVAHATNFGSVSSLEDAEALMALPSGDPGILAETFLQRETINFDDESSNNGHFGADEFFPAGGATAGHPIPTWVPVGGYQVLPYHEEQALYDLGSGMSAADKLAANAERLQTPLSIHYCPSRRPAQNYPVPDSSSSWVRRPIGSLPLEVSTRNDYVANGGEGHRGHGAGPSAPWEADTYTDWPDPFDPDPELKRTGIVFTRSEFTLRHVTDGTSHTYLVGEKYVNPNRYEDGRSLGDNQGLYVGDDLDSVRWAELPKPANNNLGLPPLQDTTGLENNLIFGSAHPGRFFMAMCVGSVQRVSYDVDNRVHVAHANRESGETLR